MPEIPVDEAIGKRGELNFNSAIIFFSDCNYDGLGENLVIYSGEKFIGIIPISSILYITKVADGVISIRM